MERPWRRNGLEGLCDVCLAIQVPTCSPSSSCHPFSLPLERRASTLHTLQLFSISRTDIIKLATVNTYRSIKSLLFDHGINQIYAGAVTSRSMLKHNESIRPPTTSITSRYRREADSWEAYLGARASCAGEPLSPCRPIAAGLTSTRAHFSKLPPPLDREHIVAPTMSCRPQLSSIILSLLLIPPPPCPAP
jgi:hypothetical protein